VGIQALRAAASRQGTWLFGCKQMAKVSFVVAYSEDELID